MPNSVRGADLHKYTGHLITIDGNPAQLRPKATEGGEIR